MSDPTTAAPTHGRHCSCSACAAEDWTNPDLAPCGMHGPSCPAFYAPYWRGEFGDDLKRAGEQMKRLQP